MIHLVGDSHANRLGRMKADSLPGIAFLGNHGKNIRQMQITESSGGLRLQADLVKGFAPLDTEIPATSELVILSGPLHSAPFTRHATWKRFAPWPVSELPPESRYHVMSQAVFEAILDNYLAAHLAAHLELVTACRRLRIPIAVLEPPKISPRIVKIVRAEEQVLRAVDQRFRHAVRARLAAAEVPVIDTPPETNDGSFMLPAFQAGVKTDISHGNEAYADRAAASIVAYCETQLRIRLAGG